jgi:hypothetical protein
MAVTANWDNLRPWKNSQNTAFEELCCQLAEYELAPPGAKFIRKGTPDAGVECFWILPTGGEWGWQAKFLFPPFGPAQWRQLDESVYTALDNHPNLIRYTVCLPFNRSDPRGQKGHKSFLDLWNERVNKWQSHARRDGRSVEFNYWGDSEIHGRLTKEEHAGRYKFWFDKEFFSQNWFASHIKEVIANAGDRYTPIVNIDLPIARVFDGLGRSPELFATIDSLHEKIRKAFGVLPLGKLSDIAPSHAQELRQRIPALFKVLSEMRRNDWSPLPFGDLAGIEIKSTQQCIDFLRQKRDAHNNDSQLTPNAATSSAPDFREETFHLYRLLEALYELRQFAKTSCAIAANKPSLLIVGGAGSGKTHLLCDIADHRINNGWPTVVLLGEQFGSAEPWKQILDLLKLDCTPAEFLGALDAVALAVGTRALILIDALNEGDGQKIWSKHLAGMLTHLENYPRIGIALSVRSSYEKIIVPEQLVSNQKLVREEHHGFEEHEYEAANRFFAHFGIEPSVPLLYPEFKNPQFLLLFCKGLKNKSLSRIPPGLHGITLIFDFYLDSINEKLARSEYLGFDVSDRLVQRATEKITKLMAQKAARWLPRDQARRSIDALLPGREYDRSLFRHLIGEGVFAEDLLYSSGKKKAGRVVRFSYERFADHRIAKLTLAAHLNKKDPERSFAANRPLGALFRDNYTCWLNQGLIEALCIQLPEQVQKELPELLPRSLTDLGSIRLAFVESLLWRTRKAFGKSTLKYINEEILRYGDSRQQLWNAVITLAPVPGHPLNADFLHKHLIAFSMADRDAWWSTFIHRQYRTQSAIDRLLDWAWSPLKTGELDMEAGLLCATAMTWLLTSSNRFLRDNATKSLVRVIGTRSDILLPLLKKFRSVNDAYVLERICAIAYGCAMKDTNTTNLQALASFVYDWIFADGKPYSHILVRDYARGVVEAALNSGAQLQIDLSKVRPPYKTAWPKTIPSKAELETKYGWRQDKMPQAEWARLSIYDSVMGFGDFARYVIGTNSGSFEWSKIRLGQRPAITAKDKYDAFLKGLKGIQRKAWDKAQNLRWQNALVYLAKGFPRRSDQAGTNVRREMVTKKELQKAQQAFEATLSSSELRRYRTDALTYLAKPRNEDNRFDLSVAQRWILQRVFDLGWTVEKFGVFDRDVNAHIWSRDAKKSERIGKKYQWIAYHEFLGLVADNFEFGNELYSDAEKKYDGPWQMYVRDIDPSCALRDIPGGDKAEDAWWSPRTAYNWESEHRNSSWINSITDLPLVEPLIQVSSPEDGSGWLVLESYPEWKEPIPSYEEDFEKPRKWLWYQLRSFLVDRKNAAKAFEWLSKQDFWGRWMPENPEHHAVFLGEFYWAPALRRHDPIVDPRTEGSNSRMSALSFPLVFTSGSYHSEMNSFDCSAEERFSVFLPGAWIVKKMGLQWNGIEGRFFDSAGTLVAFDPALSYAGPHALLIRKEAFISFVKEQGYEIIWFLLGGKQILGGGWDRKDWPGELQISGVYRVKTDRVSGKLRPKIIKPHSK